MDHMIKMNKDGFNVMNVKNGQQLYQISQNHINGEEKFRNQSIREETENKVYYCLNCTKAMKKQNL